ncbi:MAG TPA: chloride channel protein [Acidobacteriaceae bacterium]
MTPAQFRDSTVRVRRYVLILMESAVIGALSGLACVAVRLFFRLLQQVITGESGLLSSAAAHLPLWRRGITPALGGLAALAVLAISRRLGAISGFKDYVEAVRLEEGHISLRPTLWRTISSAFSIATGAAIGREGSMIQFAAAVVSSLGRRVKHVQLPLAQQVACGVAAAVAAAYQAPIAGMFFALEIVIGRFAWDEVPSLLAAAVAGGTVSRALLGAGPLFAPRLFPLHGLLGIDLPHASLLLPMAVLLGVLGPLYSWLVRSLQGARKLPVALFWSGALVGALSLFTTEVWGNGDAGLLSIMQSSPALAMVLVVLLCRICATTLCVGTGAVGGVFTPTLFAGSAMGLLAGHMMHIANPPLFAIIGMGCLLAAVTHAPLMATFMAVELTGQWPLLPLALICNLVAWQIAIRISPRSRSLYALASPVPTDSFAEDTSQILANSHASFHARNSLDQQISQTEVTQ